MDNESKNERMRESFYRYCKKHPQLRFFQALRNWVQSEIDSDVNFIFVAPIEYLDAEDYRDGAEMLKDTFYWEDDRLG